VIFSKSKKTYKENQQIHSIPDHRGTQQYEHVEDGKKDPRKALVHMGFHKGDIKGNEEGSGKKDEKKSKVGKGEYECCPDGPVFTIPYGPPEDKKGQGGENVLDSQKGSLNEGIGKEPEKRLEKKEQAQQPEGCGVFRVKTGMGGFHEGSLLFERVECEFFFGHMCKQKRYGFIRFYSDQEYKRPGFM
jgi:hypothetical protein